MMQFSDPQTHSTTYGNTLEEARANLEKVRRGFGVMLVKETYLAKPFNIPKDLDPELKHLVIELNNSGYKTLSSCAGHYSEAPYGRGYINLKDKLTLKDEDKLKQILSHYGLSDIKVRWNTQGFTDIGFAPFGKLRGRNLFEPLPTVPLSEGKPVPPEVLKDYPDLAKKAVRS